MLVEGAELLLFSVHVPAHLLTIMWIILQHWFLLGFIPDTLQTGRQISLHFIAKSVLALTVVPVHHSQVAVELLVNLYVIFSPARVHLAAAVELFCQIDGVFADDLPVDQ